MTTGRQMNVVPDAPTACPYSYHDPAVYGEAAARRLDQLLRQWQQSADVASSYARPNERALAAVEVRRERYEAAVRRVFAMENGNR